MPDLTEMFAVLFLIGVVSSGTTQILKLAGRKLVPKGTGDPVWWQVTFRVVPTLVGTALGTQFFAYPWGMVIGASAGLLSAVLFNKARKIVENLSTPKV
jgi:hypothetical protein